MNMKWILLFVLFQMRLGIGYANEPTTIDLTGGAQMEFVWIEPGTFTMGPLASQSILGSDRISTETPQHQVTISHGFWLGTNEVTQAQWETVMGTSPWSEEEWVQADASHPAVYISWNDVQAFIHQLNEAAGESLYRLPTEAEWEYAARAGTMTLWSSGNDENQLGDYAWYSDNTWDLGLKYAQPVGTKLPNPWGLHDMHGNVWEWVQDWYGSYSSSPSVDPVGPTSGPGRIVRGGSFSSDAQEISTANRTGGNLTSRANTVGFRLLRMEPAPTTVSPQGWGQIKDGVMHIE